MNALARTILVVSIAFACWMAGTGNSAAHTSLAGSDPAEGATEDTAPAIVTLTFTEDINRAFANVAVSSSDGRDWVSGPAQITGPQLRISLSPDLPDAADYTVGYRVVSADGHAVAGSFTFKVAAASVAAAPATPSNSATPTIVDASPTTAPPPSSGPLGSDSKASVLSAAAAGLLLGGAIVFWQSRRRRRTDLPDNEPS